MRCGCIILIACVGRRDAMCFVKAIDWAKDVDIVGGFEVDECRVEG